ncbi:unnamed protein product [Clonostachys chloroleuca]|uniref:Protein RTM1 n=1 Tax=Clonostachys chloroleuca TaxID=1926264 RepID=A0AA35LQ53_9HYPO|nr:unnamed protein product [Clonostachys chloroleuca]
MPLIIGCGIEAAGYYFRSQLQDDVRPTLPFIIQNLLVLAAPPFLAASIFMSPRRIARALDSGDLVATCKLASKVFVVVDVTCFVTRVVGAIMSGSENPDEAQSGKTTIVEGLIVQATSFSIFAIWAGSSQWRLRSVVCDGSRLGQLHWRQIINALYAISLLFILCSIAGIIEYHQGSDGEMLSKEVYLYILDGTVMLVISILFLVFHPSSLKVKAQKLLAKGDGYMDEEIQLR